MLQEVKIILSWENKKSFTMKAFEDDKTPVIIVKAEEDGCISLLWENLASAARLYFERQLDKIGTEMKKP